MSANIGARKVEFVEAGEHNSVGFLEIAEIFASSTGFLCEKEPCDIVYDIYVNALKSTQVFSDA